MSPPRHRNCPASTGGRAFETHFSIAHRAVKQNAPEASNFTFLKMFVCDPQGLPATTPCLAFHVAAELRKAGFAALIPPAALASRLWALFRRCGEDFPIQACHFFGSP
jgi:hypothetical protein